MITVAGPPNSGATTVAVALGRALPDHRVVEWTAPHRGTTPDVVVFVVSAAAPMTPSQAALLDSVLEVTGRVPVVAAVSKIDLYRDWADVLDVNRGPSEDPHVATAWVGVAADPDIGEPRMDALIDGVRHCRIRVTRPPMDATRLSDRRAAAIMRRGELAQARLRLGATIRTGCAEMRTELQRQAARLNRRGLHNFREQALARIAAAVGEWDQVIGAEFDTLMRSVATEDPALPAEPVPAIAAGPPQGADPTELRLSVLIGAVFGGGAALTATRLVSGLVGGWSSAVGVLVGFGLAAWVIGSRRLLAERAVMLRWTADVLAAARQTLEERVASQALAVEVAMGLAAADRR